MGGLGNTFRGFGHRRMVRSPKARVGRKPDFRQAEVWEVTPLGGDIGGLGNPFKGFGQRCVV